MSEKNIDIKNKQQTIWDRIDRLPGKEEDKIRAKYLISTLINKRFKDGWTPLMAACKYGKMDLFKKLLFYFDVDVNAKSNSGKTALMIACTNKEKEMVKMLIEKGVDVNQQDNTLRTALFYAVTNGNKEIVELLLKHKADPTIIDGSGRSVLSYALEKGYIDIAEILQKKIAKINFAVPKIVDDNPQNKAA